MSECRHTRQPRAVLTWNPLLQATSFPSLAGLVRATAYALPAGASYVPCIVPHDRWLVTHLHTSWKITDVKLWLLAKYFPTLFTHAPSIPRQRFSKRRVSPIKFAKREEVSDDEQMPADVAYGDTDYFGALPGVDDDPVLSDKYKYVPRIGSPGASSSDILPRPSAASHYADPSNFTLLSYSTNQILEDGWRFGWYTVHPHELLELHTYPYIVKLPRSSVLSYYQPYFESSAWVLRLIDDFGSGNRVADGSGRLGETVDGDKDKTRKRKKFAHWHPRWIVVREGHFYLYKDRNVSFQDTAHNGLSYLCLGIQLAVSCRDVIHGGHSRDRLLERGTVDDHRQLPWTKGRFQRETDFMCKVPTSASTSRQFELVSTRLAGRKCWR